jgi:hypothetical protein
LELVPVYSPFGGWQLIPNLMGPPLYGLSGFGNFFNTYTWSMEIYGDQLFVGTFDWSYLLKDVGGEFAFLLLDALDIPVPDGMDFEDFEELFESLTCFYGGDLFRFPSSSDRAIPESIAGVDNHTNYGIRNMVSDDALYLGMANPMNLLTDLTDDLPEGGWELIQLGPSIACAQEVWVDDDYCADCDNDGHTCDYDAFNTIEMALHAVCPGGVVTIYDGTYPESGLMIIKDGLTIQAGSKPVIDGGGGVGLWIFANDITLSGFEFTNCQPALVLGPHWMLGPISGFDVHDCHFNNNVFQLAMNVVLHSGTVEAENNYWDSCTGPQHINNQRGRGEVILPYVADVDYVPWLNPCAVAWGDTCLHNNLMGTADNFLVGSGPQFADQDSYAVGFYNPLGEARLTSISFSGTIPVLWICRSISVLKDCVRPASLSVLEKVRWVCCWVNLTQVVSWGIGIGRRWFWEIPYVFRFRPRAVSTSCGR